MKEQKFNTAILYDIENLMGGYVKAEYLPQLSLKDIFEEISKKDIDKIAIQRAYANWSDSRLNILRGDIVELGIEPVQMFGFGRGPKKNASDIQLAIDAVEIALTKPAIEKFVIVSGDGGFSALAKKLHEYGKLVIGCAYRKSVNRVFEAVCDDFIWIEPPTAEEEEIVPAASEGEKEFTNPILIAFAKKFRPEEIKDDKKVLQKARDILEFFKSNEEARSLLENVGMNIAIYSQALSYSIKDFNYMRFGFSRFVDFIRFVTNGTDIKLIHRPPSEYRLLMRGQKIAMFRDVEPLKKLSDLHSAENYRELLGRNNPPPWFPLPPTEVIFHVAEYLAEHRNETKGMLIGDITERLSTDLEYSQKEIRGAVISLLNADCFRREPEDGRIAEQRLTFRYKSSLTAIKMLRKAVRAKLRRMLGSVKDRELSKIINVRE